MERRAATTRSVAELILEQAIAGSSASAGMVFTVDEEAGVLVQVAARGYPEGAASNLATLSLDAALPEPEAARSRAPIFVTSPGDLSARYPDLAVAPTTTHSFVFAPLLARARAIGVLTLSFERARVFGESERAFVTAFANVGAVALAHAEGGEAERLARERLGLLAHASHLLSESPDLDAGIASIAELLVPSLGDSCAVTIVDEQGNPSTVSAGASPDSAPSTPRSTMTVPLSAHGHALGTLTLALARPDRRYEPEDRELAEELGRRIGVAVDNARLTQQMQASEERLAGILASAMDAIITIDVTQRVLLFNAAAERMFGVSAEEMIGRPVSELIPERFRAAHAVHVRHFGETGETRRSMGRLGTLWGLRADGSEFPIEATISKLSDRGSMLFTVILRDVTDRVAKEQELADAARHKDHFLAMLGHELRNPLAAINTAVEVQHQVDLDGDPVLIRSRDVIDRQVRHMVRLIDDLLDVSRIARGKIALHPEEVDLASIVRTVCSDAEEPARRAELRLDVVLPGSAWVKGDQARLVQVAENLVGNAIKFTDPGGVIRVILTTSEGRHILEVSDTGIGMQQRAIGQLFEPFRQADESLARTQGGLGLGLAVARGVVQMHGGTIDASSPGPGRGSTFVVALPATDPPPDEKEAEGAMLTLPFERFLVIEDNEDAAVLLADILGLAGATTSVAFSGEVGVERVRTERPEVVLCDIGLPAGMDGYDVARAIRAEPELESVLLIAITGYGLPEDAEKAREAGFDAHLTKPVELRRLVDVLHRLAEG